MYMFMCVHTRIRRPAVEVRYLPSTLLTRQGLSLDRDLTNSTGLVGQQGPWGSCCSYLPSVGDATAAECLVLVFYKGAGDRTQVFMLTKSAL